MAMKATRCTEMSGDRSKKPSKAERSRRAGRPPEGIDMIDRLGGGTPESRRRLGVILRSLAGELTVEEACDLLDVGRSRFHAMRRGFLLEAPSLLEAGVPGPVPRSVNQELERLRQENAKLQDRAMMAELREEIQILNVQDPAVSEGPTRTAKRGGGTSKKRFIREFRGSRISRMKAGPAVPA